jgi:hypothetical protein
VRYCKRAADMGMPPNCYTKALREPVHFLGERRGGRSKRDAAEYSSEKASQLPFNRGLLHYDHAIPFVYAQRELLALRDVSVPAVTGVLFRLLFPTWLTVDEHDDLSSRRLGNEMPSDWNGTDPYARYNAIGIRLVPNVHFRTAPPA